MEGDWYVSSPAQRCARMLNSSQMVGAGVAHLAYRGSFSQEALNWIGNRPEDVNLEETLSDGTELMWQNNECVRRGFALVPAAI